MLPDKFTTEIIEIVLRSGKRRKYPNNSEPAPAKHGRKDNLTKDDIPTIKEAVLDAMEARANIEVGRDRQTICSSGRQVTLSSNYTRSHHGREMSSTAN